MMSLFTPYRKLGLKNRAVLAPMTRYSCSELGLPTAKLAEYYVDKAKGGVGLIVVESCAINDAEAVGYVNGARFHSERHSDAWKPILKKINDAGAKVWVQLFHAGRLTVKEVAGFPPVSASALPPDKGLSFWRPDIDGEVCHFQTKTPFQVPRELSTKEIKTVIKQFAKACAFAEKAGFDGAELHGAHGYLLHQFAHRSTNIREDGYGASGDFRFIKELVIACREAVSKSFLLSYRLSVHMVDNSYVRYDKADYNIPALVKILDQCGIDVFHSSEIRAGAPVFGAELSLNEIIRTATNKPLIVCGGINSEEEANDLLENNADLVAFGRSLISNPALINNWENDRGQEIVKFSYSKHMQDLI